MGANAGNLIVGSSTDRDGRAITFVCQINPFTGCDDTVLQVFAPDDCPRDSMAASQALAEKIVHAFNSHPIIYNALFRAQIAMRHHAPGADKVALEIVDDALDVASRMAASIAGASTRDLELAVLERAIDRMGWPEIHAYQDELRKGQDVYEDAGGFFMRAIRRLFGLPNPYDEVVTYQQAARAMVEKAGAAE